jgi:hypothetical protein
MTCIFSSIEIRFFKYLSLCGDDDGDKEGEGDSDLWVFIPFKSLKIPEEIGLKSNSFILKSRTI